MKYYHACLVGDRRWGESVTSKKQKLSTIQCIISRKEDFSGIKTKGWPIPLKQSSAKTDSTNSVSTSFSQIASSMINWAKL